jgi:hypothetical protein
MDERVEQLKRAEQEGFGAGAEMPRYKSHKQVWALKIAEIIDPREPGNESDGSRVIIPADQGYGAFRVDRAYVQKHNPQVGGYYVVYADGYRSWSPAQAFEEGYTRV